MKLNQKILPFVILMLLLPPGAWFVLCVYLNLFTLSELKIILSDPVLGVVMIFFIGLILTFTIRTFNRIQSTINNQDKNIEEQIQKDVAYFPVKLFIINIPYAVFGSSAALILHEFVDNVEFILGEALAIPLLFSLSAMVFIIMIYSFEKCTKQLPLSNSIRALSIKSRFNISAVSTIFGALILISASAITLIYKHPGVDLLYKTVSIKLIPICAFCIIICTISIFTIGSKIASSFNKTAMISEIIANNDLVIDKLQIDTRDEIGRMNLSLNTMVTNLKSIIGEIKITSGQMSSMSSNLITLSDNLETNTSNMATKSSDVASAAEEMSVNITSVSLSAEEFSSNIDSVSAATEEMASTIAEIAQNTEKAKNLSSTAVSKALSATEKINNLGQNAGDIKTIIENITDIAEMTKLLALNATIESARAGEAGKGFSVVAGEVKELAKQTNEAVIDIQKKVEVIKNSTDSAVTEVQEINAAINYVNDVVANIASAIEEQSVVVKNISKSINEATQGVSEVSTMFTESAKVTQSIAIDISSLNESVNETKASGGSVKESAEELNKVGGMLKNLTEKFKI